MRIISKLKGKFFKKQPPLYRSSERVIYSQNGEDIIVKFIFERMGIQNPVYLDLGAHHPNFLNNTYIFYKSGCRGVNVEPDPTLIGEFTKLRPGDINLNVGIGFNATEELADFFVMSDKVYNTFSREEAEKIQQYGTYKIDQVLKVLLVPLKTIMDNFKTDRPNFVSLDVEGLDYDIIRTFDLSGARPEVFCIETTTYTEDNTERKLTEIIDYMTANGYFVYADTYINTIFVDKQAWLNR